MNENKLRQLINAARAEAPPAIGPGLEARVLRAIHREHRLEPGSWFDQFGELCPRLALAAVLMIGACVAADVCLSALAPMDLSEGAMQLSEQWLFAVR
jgi:hypothetical protein